MKEAESLPPKTLYVIENEAYEGKGPFTGGEIEGMLNREEIPKKQKVRKVHTGKVIEARNALFSAQVNDQPPSPPTKGKFFAGFLVLILGLAAVAFLFYAREEGESVRIKLFIIPGLMIFGGVKMISTNFKALKAEQDAEPNL